MQVAAAPTIHKTVDIGVKVQLALYPSIHSSLADACGIIVAKAAIVNSIEINNKTL